MKSNSSLQTGIVPNKLKMAGDRLLASNYGPVILTSIVGKLMELVIAKAIQSHLERHKLINESQQGPQWKCVFCFLGYPR